MRIQQTNFIRGGRRSLLTVLALAATCFVSVNVRAASEDSSASQLLAASLPEGVSLRTASDAQMTEAVKSAVARDPRMAEGIVRVAIVTKVPAAERKAAPRRMRRSRPRGDGKSISQNSTYNPWATAGVSNARPFVLVAATTNDAESFIAAVISAAVAASPDSAAAIVAAAISVAPAFAITITQTAINVAPGQSATIIAAASGAAPDQAGEIAALAPGGGGEDNGGGGSGNLGAVSAAGFGGGGGGGGSAANITSNEMSPTTNP